MLIYTDHFYNGREWVAVRSDEGRAVMVDGVPFEIIWMPRSELKPCTEGEPLAVGGELDDAEALAILLGVSE